MKVQFKRNVCCEYDKNVMAYAKNGLRESLRTKTDSLFRDLLLNFNVTKLYA